MMAKHYKTCLKNMPHDKTPQQNGPLPKICFLWVVQGAAIVSEAARRTLRQVLVGRRAFEGPIDGFLSTKFSFVAFNYYSSLFCVAS